MHISELPAFQDQKADSEEALGFDKSLQELRDLRFRLHYAADYCEAKFLNAEEKKSVLENTKEYICRALVTVVDHLGNVSANLDNCIPNTNAFSEAKLRLNCLKQRLLSCELYAHKLALNRVRWNPALPIYDRRYLSAPIIDVANPNKISRDSKFPSTANITDKHVFDIEDVPLFMYTYTDKASSVKNPPSKTKIIPVRDGISILCKDSNPTFHFQQCNQSPRPKSLHRRSLQNNEIKSLIRRIKRTT